MITVPKNNPFTENEETIRDRRYEVAYQLRNLVLHLYNHNCGSLNLGWLLRNADDKHMQIALDMMEWYKLHGEGDLEFMRIAGAIHREWYDSMYMDSQETDN